MLKLLLAAFVAYAVVVAFMYFSQQRMLYLPTVPERALRATPDDAGLPYRDVTLQTEDGVRLHGWFVPAAGPRVLLFFHGNAGNVSHRLESLRLFHELGMSVLIIDYRGYGESGGTPTEQGTYLDADAAWRHLTQTLDVAPERIVVFGRSLGAAVAAWLAARVQPAGLIVESAFTSVPDLGQELYPWLPVRWLSRFDYATSEYVAKVRCPVLVVHSRDDEIAPFRHAERILGAVRGPRTLLVLEGSHNEAHVLSERRYAAGLREFLESLGALPELP
ncbi:MAG: alpha/beta hydrolase [Gammaproteobacteria bacterium]|nr:alpha/beta hydrolase [Gammaproteobacteria bacterium]